MMQIHLNWSWQHKKRASDYANAGSAKRVRSKGNLVKQGGRENDTGFSNRREKSLNDR